jgi:hypothetical protein
MNFAAPASGLSLLSEIINDLIDKALEAENAAQPKRTYLGASIIGTECERRLAYGFHGHDGEAFPGKAIRRFRLGHLHEDETAAWLRKAGFDLRTHDESGEQFGFSLADGRFAGHTDGIIVGGPNIGREWPALWEHKIMKSSIWTATKKVGVREKHYTYYAQCQIYMRQFGLSWALFTALNTDTSELLFEVIDYNAAEAEALIAKAARIIESKAPEELPRVGANEMDYRCKWCPFAATCWKPVEVVAPVRPAWLKAP